MIVLSEASVQVRRNIPPRQQAALGTHSAFRGAETEMLVIVSAPRICFYVILICSGN